MTQNRNDPSRCLIIVVFDSYGSAIENPKLPETQEFAAKWASAVDGPTAFRDLDVIDDRG